MGRVGSGRAGPERVGLDLPSISDDRAQFGPARFLPGPLSSIFGEPMIEIAVVISDLSLFQHNWLYLNLHSSGPPRIFEHHAIFTTEN